MKSDPDLYSILGVDPAASPEQIRAAYLARSRDIHPDQFDRYSQSREWTSANDRQSELNGAYAVLKDPEKRRAYDQQRRSTRVHAQRSSSQPLDNDYDGPEFSEGYFRFQDLPPEIQSRLRTRQVNRGQDQFQVLSVPIWRNLAFIVLASCWFIVLYALSGGEHWSALAAIGYCAATAAVSAVIGWNALAVMRWIRAPVVPAFYVSPLYFIKTGYNSVGYWPIWSFKDFRVTHRYENGSYKNSVVMLAIHDRWEWMTLSSERQVRRLFDQINDYQQRFVAAAKARDGDYFVEFDDFRCLDRRSIPRIDALDFDDTTNIDRASTYGASLALCLLVLVGLAIYNAWSWENRWVRHPDPSVGPDRPDQFARVAPREPAPPATSVRQHPTIPAQSIPRNGWTRQFVTGPFIAPFEIRADSGTHYLVKLVKFDGTTVMTVFVRAGATAQVDVPLGIYEVRYAAGTEWYGTEYLFGPDTAYCKTDHHFHFTRNGDELTGYTITLYKVPNGNLGTVAIAPTAF